MDRPCLRGVLLHGVCLGRLLMSGVHFPSCVWFNVGLFDFFLSMAEVAYS